MFAYVINLDSRKDRLDLAYSQQELIGVPLIRVPAISTLDLKESDVRFAAPGVAATWLSHRKAAKEFLNTDERYAIILEDDFQLSRPLEIPRMDWLLQNKVDFLQIGYLRVTKWETIDLLFINLRDLLLRIVRGLSCVTNFLDSSLSSRLLIRELPNSNYKLVPTDIRPGGHCYLISRHFAESMQVLNDPIIFSTDELFVSISKMRAFKMLRFKWSKVGQNNSPSSVIDRFKLN